MYSIPLGAYWFRNSKKLGFSLSHLSLDQNRCCGQAWSKHTAHCKAQRPIENLASLVIPSLLHRNNTLVV